MTSPYGIHDPNTYESLLRRLRRPQYVDYFHSVICLRCLGLLESQTRVVLDTIPLLDLSRRTTFLASLRSLRFRYFTLSRTNPSFFYALRRPWGWFLTGVGFLLRAEPWLGIRF